MAKIIGGLSIVGTLRKLEGYEMDDRQQVNGQWVSSGNKIAMFAIKVLRDDPDSPEDVEVLEFHVRKDRVAVGTSPGMEVMVTGYVDQFQGQAAKFKAEAVRPVGGTAAPAAPRVTANGAARETATAAR